MKKIYIGIDVGQNGGIFAMDEDRNVILKSDIPKDSDKNVDYQALLAIFNNIKARAWMTVQDSVEFAELQYIAVIEDVHSLFGMSAKSNFSFGHIKGVKEAMMVALKIEYTLVPPKTWQKLIWSGMDKVTTTGKTGKSKTDTKATSLNAAERIFPKVDFRASDRARKPHDGIVDAALMAEFARATDRD